MAEQDTQTQATAVWDHSEATGDTMAQISDIIPIAELNYLLQIILDHSRNGDTAAHLLRLSLLPFQAGASQ